MNIHERITHNAASLMNTHQDGEPVGLGKPLTQVEPFVGGVSVVIQPLGQTELLEAETVWIVAPDAEQFPVAFHAVVNDEHTLYFLDELSGWQIRLKDITKLVSAGRLRVRLPTTLALGNQMLLQNYVRGFSTFDIIPKEDPRHDPPT